MSLSVFKPISYEARRTLCDSLGLNCIANEIHTETEPLKPPSDVYEVESDGNCLFRALSYAVCGDEEHYGYFRNVIVSYLSFDKVGKQIQPKENYVTEQEMGNNHVWGTDIEILAAASLFKVTILVYTVYGNKCDWVIFNPVHRQTKSDGAIYLHHKNQNHYDVVTSVSTEKVKSFDFIHYSVLVKK